MKGSKAPIACACVTVDVSNPFVELLTCPRNPVLTTFLFMIESYRRMPAFLISATNCRRTKMYATR